MRNNQEHILGEWEYFEIEIFSDGGVLVWRLRDQEPIIRLKPDIARYTHTHCNLVQSNYNRETCTEEEYLEYTRIFDFLAGLQRTSFDDDLRLKGPPRS